MTRAPAQEPLFGESVDPDMQQLGENQQLVLQAIRNLGRVEPDEAGALIHARRGRHPEDTRCDWCARDGRQVLTSLKKRGYLNGRKAKTAGPSADGWDNLVQAGF